MYAIETEKKHITTSETGGYDKKTWTKLSLPMILVLFPLIF